MTTEVKLETKEVDINGVKIVLPVEQADKLIQARDAEKQSRKDQAEKYGKLEAEKAQAEAARAKAEEDKQAMELAKKGEIDQLKVFLTKASSEREAKLAASARDKHIAALVGSNEKIIKSATQDIVDQLKSRTKYDFDSDTVVVLDPDGLPAKGTDGKPMGVDSFLSGWLENRPHYLRDGSPKGTGAAGGVKQTGKVMSADAIAQMTPMDKAKYFADGGAQSK